jgi:hypothetical protein
MFIYLFGFIKENKKTKRKKEKTCRAQLLARMARSRGRSALSFSPST